MANAHVERLKALPRKAGAVWQAAIVAMVAPDEVARMPEFQAYRAQMAVAIGVTPPEELAVVTTEKPGPVSPAQVLEALAQVGVQAGRSAYRPGRIEVDDEVLAGALRTALAELEIEIAVLRRLPTLQKAIEDVLAGLSEMADRPGTLSGRGVTPDRTRAFAEAAKEFYEAEPWSILSIDDLIEIEAPKTDASLRFAAVIKADGENCGLSLYPSRRVYDLCAFRNVPELWLLFFSNEAGTALEDFVRWEAEDLPLAGPEAYPQMYKDNADGDLTPPDAKVLAFTEGLLRALARTTEAEADLGRWRKTVPTADGEVTYQLALVETGATPPNKSGRGTELS